MNFLDFFSKLTIKFLNASNEVEDNDNQLNIGFLIGGSILGFAAICYCCKNYNYNENEDLRVDNLSSDSDVGIDLTALATNLAGSDISADYSPL